MLRVENKNQTGGVKMDYWNKHIRAAFANAKIMATEDQVYSVASYIRGATESHSSTSVLEENTRMKHELGKTTRRIPCELCNGLGFHLGSFNDCRVCKGTGLVYELR